jgi:hypothetical protein
MLFEIRCNVAWQVPLFVFLRRMLPSSAVKMEASCSSKMLVPAYHASQESSPPTHCCELLKSLFFPDINYLYIIQI